MTDTRHPLQPSSYSGVPMFIMPHSISTCVHRALPPHNTPVLGLSASRHRSVRAHLCASGPAAAPLGHAPPTLRARELGVPARRWTTYDADCIPRRLHNLHPTDTSRIIGKLGGLVPNLEAHINGVEGAGDYGCAAKASCKVTSGMETLCGLVGGLRWRVFLCVLVMAGEGLRNCG